MPRSLRALAQPMVADTGETLFRTGDPVRNILCIVDGEARLVRSDIHGNTVILQRSRAGFIAEASLDTPHYHCDAIAAEPTHLLRFPCGPFLSALENAPAFRSSWQSLLAREVRKLRAQCERLSLNSAAERISHCIASEGHGGVLVLHQTRKSWAAELGLSHEALYRTLSRMQAEGKLVVNGNQISSKPAQPN